MRDAQLLELVLAGRVEVLRKRNLSGDRLMWQSFTAYAKMRCCRYGQLCINPAILAHV